MSRRRRASAAVETALLLPFLLLVAVGATDLGRFSYANIAVATAARNGAQYGSTSKTAAKDTTGIKTAAQSETSGLPGYSSSNPTVTSTYTSSSSKLSVTVSFQFNSLMRYPGLPSSVTITRTVKLRVIPG